MGPNGVDEGGGSDDAHPAAKGPRLNVSRGARAFFAIAAIFVLTTDWNLLLVPRRGVRLGEVSVSGGAATQHVGD